jgi:TRAP-type C4-dicarboxylate transport system permease small subunit
MKKLSMMIAAVMSVLGFSMAAVLPQAFAVGFLVEALGVTNITKLISALLALGFFFLGLNPIIA